MSNPDHVVEQLYRSAARALPGYALLIVCWAADGTWYRSNVKDTILPTAMRGIAYKLQKTGCSPDADPTIHTLAEVGRSHLDGRGILVLAWSGKGTWYAANVKDETVRELLRKLAHALAPHEGTVVAVLKLDADGNAVLDKEGHPVIELVPEDDPVAATESTASPSPSP